MSEAHATVPETTTRPYILAVEWDKSVPGSYTAVIVTSPDSEIHRFETGDPVEDFYAAVQFIGEEPFIEDESLRDFDDHNLGWHLEFYVDYPPYCFPSMTRELIEGIVEQANGQRPRWEYGSETKGKLYVGPVTLNMGDGGYYQILLLPFTIRETRKFLIDCRRVVGRPQQVPGAEIQVGMFEHPGGWMYIADVGTPPHASVAECIEMPAAIYAVIACHDKSGLRSFYRVEPVGDSNKGIVH